MWHDVGDDAVNLRVQNWAMQQMATKRASRGSDIVSATQTEEALERARARSSSLALAMSLSSESLRLDGWGDALESSGIALSSAAIALTSGVAVAVLSAENESALWRRAWFASGEAIVGCDAMRENGTRDRNNQRQDPEGERGGPGLLKHRSTICRATDAAADVSGNSQIRHSRLGPLWWREGE